MLLKDFEGLESSAWGDAAPSTVLIRCLSSNLQFALENVCSYIFRTT